jgi:predicted nucleic acid-binding protein
MNDLVIIDTSSWIEALRKSGNADVRNRVKTIMIEGRAACCDMILLELWNGAKGDPERKMIKELENEIMCLPTTIKVWTFAKELAKKCRKSGKTIPSTDILIVSCGIVNNVSIESHDKHFPTLIQMTQK